MFPFYLFPQCSPPWKEISPFSLSPLFYKIHQPILASSILSQCPYCVCAGAMYFFLFSIIRFHFSRGVGLTEHKQRTTSKYWEVPSPPHSDCVSPLTLQIWTMNFVSTSKQLSVAVISSRLWKGAAVWNPWFNRCVSGWGITFFLLLLFDY